MATVSQLPTNVWGPTDMKSLSDALNQAQVGTGEIQMVLCSATFCPRLPGLTKMISKLSKEGAFGKALEVYYALPNLGIDYDTTITNAAISACDKGIQWQAALKIFYSMPKMGLTADAITYSSVISALAKGKQWQTALQVFKSMNRAGVKPDVVTCCSLISALENGGQWQLSEEIFEQMCRASKKNGVPALSCYIECLEKIRKDGSQCNIEENSNVQDTVHSDQSLLAERLHLPLQTDMNETINCRCLWNSGALTGLTIKQDDLFSTDYLKCGDKPELKEIVPEEGFLHVSNSSKWNNNTPERQKKLLGDDVNSLISFLNISPPKQLNQAFNNKQSYTMHGNRNGKENSDPTTQKKHKRSGFNDEQIDKIKQQKAEDSQQIKDQRVNMLKDIDVTHIVPNRICCNAMLAAFARARPVQWKKALLLLQAMNLASDDLRPDVVSFNTCIKACGNALQLYFAIETYKLMINKSIQPTITTFGTLLTAASHCGNCDSLKQIWQWLISSGLEITATCVQSYVSALAKKGLWNEAQKILQYNDQHVQFKAEHVSRHKFDKTWPSNQDIELKAQSHLNPDVLLHQLSQSVLKAPQHLLASFATRGIALFQQQCDLTPLVPGHAFASLLCILGCANQWDVATELYCLVPLLETIDVEKASILINGHLTSGQFYLALHYFMALYYQWGLMPYPESCEALIIHGFSNKCMAPAITIYQALLKASIVPSNKACATAMQAMMELEQIELVVESVYHLANMGITLQSDVVAAIFTSSKCLMDKDATLLFKTLARCGIDNVYVLTSVVNLLDYGILKKIHQPLLSCLPMGDPRAGKLYWELINTFVKNCNVSAAVQVALKGHIIGVLTHFVPYLPSCGLPNLNILTVDLVGCYTEGVIVTMLAWACSYTQSNWHHMKSPIPEVVLLFGAKDGLQSETRKQVIQTVKGIFSGDSNLHECLKSLPVSLPQGAASTIVNKLSNVPDNGMLSLYPRELMVWFSALQILTHKLLIP